MKRILYFAIAAIACCACNDLIEMPAPGSEEGKIQPTPVPEDQPVTGDVVFTGLMADLSGGIQVQWAGEDKVLLWDGTRTQTLTNTAEAGPVGHFPGNIAKGDETFLAVTPAIEGVQFEGQTVNCVLPTTQSAASPLPWIRIAKSRGTTLSFLTATSQVSFAVDFEGATKVVFKTAGEKIAGDVTVDYSDEAPVVSASSDQIEIVGSFVKGQVYNFTALPGSIQSYTIVVYAGDVAKAHIFGDASTLIPGITLALPLIPEDQPTYKISRMLVWGGTGPQYGSTKIFNLFEKSVCFNTEDGRGIDALKDNYYVMGNDGSFTNYAGEDGRNWWFVFAGAQNPDTGKDVDIRKFYDVLPLSTGSWAVTGSTAYGPTVTFKDADGNVVSNASLVQPGEYTMPGTSPALKVTLEKPALMFQITGGKDNWSGSNPWNNYGVIACNPHALFIEIEQMFDGFIVPEASRTTDADFEYVPPVEPTIDLSVLPGNWKVYSNSSATADIDKYGLYVLGGSGSDPAFVSPTAKSWIWNDSIWYESDNILVIKDISVGASSVTGTTNWWAGNDGKWWDYVYKSTSEDLSQYYKQIPRGNTAFTFDIATMTVTWTGGKQAKLLGPGDHVFQYTGTVARTLPVQEGCIALHFHIMDPIPATAQQWNDVDRFVNAPLDYVIILKKQ
jgi:hypothetical protein